MRFEFQHKSINTIVILRFLVCTIQMCTNLNKYWSETVTHTERKGIDVLLVPLFYWKGIDVLRQTDTNMEILY